MPLSFNDASEKIRLFLRSREAVSLKFRERSLTPFTRITDEQSLSIGIISPENGLLALWKDLSLEEWRAVLALREKFKAIDLSSDGFFIAVFEKYECIGINTLASETAFLTACVLAPPDEHIP